MDAGTEAECKQIARVIVTEVLKAHIESCPHHTAYLISRARVIGIICGVILASGISSGTAVALIMKVFIS